MKENRITIEKNGDHCECKYVLEMADVIDTKVYDMGVSGQLPQMIPCNIETDKDMRTFEYKVVGNVTVADFLKQERNKKEILTLLYNIYTGLEAFGQNMVSLSYVAKSRKYIFVDELTLDVRFIVVPVSKETADLSEVCELTKKILAGAKYADFDRDNYVARVLTYVNSVNAFSILDAKKFVAGLLAEIGVDPEFRAAIPAPEVKAKGKVSRIGVMRKNAQNQQQMMPPMPGGQPMPPMPGGPVPPAPQPAPEMPAPEQPPVPYLLRVSTNEKIYIDKPEFTIGKSTARTDYAVDNNMVSRVHAIIERKNGVSFIKDNNSTNGTTVNGQDIAGKENIFLTNQASVVFGDEEFIYFVR